MVVGVICVQGQCFTPVNHLRKCTLLLRIQASPGSSRSIKNVLLQPSSACLRASRPGKMLSTDDSDSDAWCLAICCTTICTSAASAAVQPLSGRLFGVPVPFADSPLPGPKRGLFVVQVRNNSQDMARLCRIVTLAGAEVLVKESDGSLCVNFNWWFIIGRDMRIPLGFVHLPPSCSCALTRHCSFDSIRPSSTHATHHISSSHGH